MEEKKKALTAAIRKHKSGQLKNTKQKKYKRIPLDVSLDFYADTQAAAAAAGESVNGYIKQAISDRIKRENE